MRRDGTSAPDGDFGHRYAVRRRRGDDETYCSAATDGGLLGWPLEDGAGEDFATLSPPGGGVSPDNPDGRTTLAFQTIDDFVTPTWPGGSHPQQLHLDLSVDDIDAATPRVLELGARLHEHQPSTDGGFRVFLDPVGHPFCLIR